MFLGCKMGCHVVPMQMLSPFFMQFCCVGTVSASNIPSLEEMCSFSQSMFLFEAEKKHIAQSIVVTVVDRGC
jgi:hypothetical protein